MKTSASGWDPHAFIEQNRPRMATSMKGWLRGCSFRKKVLLHVALVSSAAIVLVCAAIGAYDSRTFKDTLLVQTRIKARIIDSSVAFAFIWNDQDYAKSTLAVLKADPHIVAACAYDSAGEVFAQYISEGSHGETCGGPQFSSLYILDDEHLTVRQPLISEGESVGTMYLKSDLKALQARQRGYAFLVLGAGLGALLGAVVLAGLLQRTFTRPLNELVRVAGIISRQNDYSVRARRYSDDELGSLTSTFNDMLTQIERADAALREGGERYRLIVETAEEGISIVDDEGKTTFANKRMGEMLGSPVEDLLGREIVSFLEEESRDLATTAMHLTRQGLREQHDLRFLSGGGRSLRTLVKTSPLVDGQGDFIGCLWMITDITAREEALLALKASEARYQDLYDNAPDMFASANGAGEIIECNRAMAATIGFTKGELLGRPIAEIHHPDCEEERRRVFEELEEHDKVTDAELQLRRRDGGKTEVSLNVSAIRDEDGNFVETRWIWRDRTARKITEEALRRSQKMESLGHLTGGIAHDFNNLLAIIIGNLDLLGLNSELTPRMRRRLEAPIKAARRGADLVSRLLAFAGRQQAERCVTDVNRVVEELNDILIGSLTKKIEIETRLSQDLWKTQIDPGELEDSVVNLAINARDAMPGGGTLTIETTNTVVDRNSVVEASGIAEGEYVLLSIRDTGVGMSEETLDHALDPFYTTKPSGEGTGLGLSMVYGFVIRSQGFLRIDSGPGRGTLIEIYLPRFDASAEDGTPETEVEAEIPGGSESILVVDDEVDVAELAKDYLSGLGYRTLVTDDPHEALEILAGGEKVDLLLSDVVMPRLSGHELAQRAIAQRPKLKVLLSSGLVAGEPGGDGEPRRPIILRKPYQLIDLALHVRQLLDHTEQTLTN